MCQAHKTSRAGTLESSHPGGLQGPHRKASPPTPGDVWGYFLALTPCCHQSRRAQQARELLPCLAAGGGLAAPRTVSLQHMSMISR